MTESVITFDKLKRVLELLDKTPGFLIARNDEIIFAPTGQPDLITHRALLKRGFVNHVVGEYRYVPIRERRSRHAFKNR